MDSNAGAMKFSLLLALKAVEQPVDLLVMEMTCHDAHVTLL